MPPAARVGDTTGHPGSIIGPGVVTVLIDNQPAAVVGDSHACSFPSAVPHPPSLIAVGSATVMIGNRPAARIGDTAACGAPIVTGALTVLIGG
ncbi:MAG: PAAR domain-containing protein [Pseudomonadota bacterium]